MEKQQFFTCNTEFSLNTEVWKPAKTQEEVLRGGGGMRKKIPKQNSPWSSAEPRGSAAPEGSGTQLLLRPLQHCHHPAPGEKAALGREPPGEQHVGYSTRCSGRRWKRPEFPRAGSRSDHDGAHPALQVGKTRVHLAENLQNNPKAFKLI